MKILFLLMTLISTASASASVGEWVRQFSNKSEMLQASQQKYQSTVQMKKEAKTKFFPDVYAEGSYTEQEVPSALTGGFNVSPKHIYDAGIVVEQPLFLGGRIWAGVRQRNSQAVKAEAILRDESNDILSNFIDLIFQIQRTKYLVDILQKSRNRLEDFVKATSKRARLGNARSFEYSQARASELSYSPRIQNLNLQLENLNLQLGSLLPEKFQPQGDGAVMLTVEQIKSLKSRGTPPLEKHPEWTQVQQDVEIAEAAKSLALGEHYPSLFVKGKWGYRSIEKEDIGTSDAKASSVSVGVTIPLFSGLSSVYIRRAQQAQVTASELAKEFKRKSLLADRQSSEKTLESLFSQMQDVTDWRENADKALKEGLKNYRLGVIDNFQVVNLQQGLEAADSTYIETVYNLNVAFKNWCMSHGMDLNEVYSPL